MSAVAVEYVFKSSAAGEGEVVSRAFSSLKSSHEPFLQVVRAERAALFPESSSTVHHDETGHVAWQAMPVLCEFLLSLRGRQLLTSARVLELGAGIGIPGLLAGRVCTELIITDSNDAVVERLRRNVELNMGEMNCSGDAIRVENVVWGADLFPSSLAHSVDIVLGSDVIYSASSAKSFLETAEAAMTQPDGIIVLAYIPRWPNVDRALYDSIAVMKLSAEVVPLCSFMSKKTSNGHALPKGTCLLLLRRMQDVDDPAEVCTDPPEITRRQYNDDVREVFDVCIGPGNITGDLCHRLSSGIGLDCEGKQQICLVIDATGPVSLTTEKARLLSDVFRVPPLINCTELKLKECWLSDGWAILTPGLLDCANKLSRLIVDGDEIGVRAAKEINKLLLHCSDLNFLGLLRNPLGNDGATAITGGLSSCSMLHSLVLSHCRIGDAGTAAIARAFPPTLQELDLSNNEISAIGVADIANAMRDSVLSKLTILNLSGNDIGASGGAELGEVLGVGVPKLQQLDLRGCGMTSSGITWLSPAIPACEDLRVLHLGSNGAGDEAMNELAPAISRCKNLKHLSLAMNSITGEGTWVLVEDLVDCLSITHIDMKGNSLGDDGAAAIADILAEVKTLEVVDLSNNEIGEEGAIAFAEEFEKPMMEEPFSWPRGLTLLLENNPEIVGAARSRLEKAVEDKNPQVVIKVKLSSVTAMETGFGR